MFEPGRDQAAGLRRLFAQHTIRVVPLICAEGTGDSISCAINLAAALARQGSRTVLIDGANGEIAPLLGLKARHDLLHLIQGECGFDQAALNAREGFRVMPAVRGLPELLKHPMPAPELFGGLGRAGEGVDVAVLVAPLETIALLLADQTQELPLICGTESRQVASVYSQLKILSATHGMNRFRAIYCRAGSAVAAAAAHDRLAAAASRFLAAEVHLGGVIEDEAVMALAERRQTSVFTVAQGSLVARSFERLATATLEWHLPVFAGPPAVTI